MKFRWSAFLRREFTRKRKSVKNAMHGRERRGDICENLHAGRAKHNRPKGRGSYPVAIARVICGIFG